MYLESLCSLQMYTVRRKRPSYGNTVSIICVSLITISASLLAVFTHSPEKLAGRRQPGITDSDLTAVNKEQKKKRINHYFMSN